MLRASTAVQDSFESLLYGNSQPAPNPIPIPIPKTEMRTASKSTQTELMNNSGYFLDYFKAGNKNIAAVTFGTTKIDVNLCDLAYREPDCGTLTTLRPPHCVPHRDERDGKIQLGLPDVDPDTFRIAAYWTQNGYIPPHLSSNQLTELKKFSAPLKENWPHLALHLEKLYPFEEETRSDKTTAYDHYRLAVESAKYCKELHIDINTIDQQIQNGLSFKTKRPKSTTANDRSENLSSLGDFIRQLDFADAHDMFLGFARKHLCNGSNDDQSAVTKIDLHFLPIILTLNPLTIRDFKKMDGNETLAQAYCSLLHELLKDRDKSGESEEYYRNLTNGHILSGAISIIREASSDAELRNVVGGLNAVFSVRSRPQREEHTHEQPPTANRSRDGVIVEFLEIMTEGLNKIDSKTDEEFIFVFKHMAAEPVEDLYDVVARIKDKAKLSVLCSEIRKSDNHDYDESKIKSDNRRLAALIYAGASNGEYYCVNSKSRNSIKDEISNLSKIRPNDNMGDRLEKLVHTIEQKQFTRHPSSGSPTHIEQQRRQHDPAEHGLNHTKSSKLTSLLYSLRRVRPSSSGKGHCSRQTTGSSTGKSSPSSPSSPEIN